MSSKANRPLVAKFGGTSMAQPEVVLSQLENDDDQADVVVVSAPGIDANHRRKVTNMLCDYGRGALPTEAIIDRFEALLARSGQTGDPNNQRIVGAMASDLENWTTNGYPIEGLGEYWSAKLFAALSGREFVDAREVIQFADSGQLNEIATLEAARRVLRPGQSYVVPGYYGSTPQGGVSVFERGGSDITGALIAKALGAREYHNWSDVPGFQSADPRRINGTRLLPRITYREARELGNGGSELLHRGAIKVLGHTGIDTIMRQTDGNLANQGTLITENRPWENQPIVAVSDRADLLALTLYEFGLNEGIGNTVDIYEELKTAGVPYEHAVTATDDVTVFMPGAQEYRQKVDKIADHLSQVPERQVSINEMGLIKIVGEGLAASEVEKGQALGKVALALAQAGIRRNAGNDSSVSPTTTMFVEPADVSQAVQLAHDTLGLGDKSAA